MTGRREIPLAKGGKNPTSISNLERQSSGFCSSFPTLSMTATVRYNNCRSAKASEEGLAIEALLVLSLLKHISATACAEVTSFPIIR